jgi:hypothetical protein
MSTAMHGNHSGPLPFNAEVVAKHDVKQAVPRAADDIAMEKTFPLRSVNR